MQEFLSMRVYPDKVKLTTIPAQYGASRSATDGVINNIVIAATTIVIPAKICSVTRHIGSEQQSNVYFWFRIPLSVGFGSETGKWICVETLSPCSDNSLRGVEMLWSGWKYRSSGKLELRELLEVRGKDKAGPVDRELLDPSYSGIPGSKNADKKQNRKEIQNTPNKNVT